MFRSTLFFFLCLAISLLFFSSCEETTTSEDQVDTLETEIQTLVEQKEEEKIVEEKTPFVPDYDTTLWTDILSLDPSIIVDMKYATEDNFVNEKMYECSRCFLRPDVAEAVVKIHQKLQTKGYGLKMLDCYRPRPIQQKLWDKVPNPSYVTPPKKGSMHNRGSAVDLTIVDNDGKELDMGTPFDFFGKKAHHDCTDLPQEVLDNRKLLKDAMKEQELHPIRTEWWHYYYAEGAPKKFPLDDMLWECPGKH